MGPKISKTSNSGQASAQQTPVAESQQANMFLDSSGFVPGSQDASMATSFIRGWGSTSPDLYNSKNRQDSDVKLGRLPSLKRGVSTQPQWSQLSRQQQRIYQQWRKAHKNQLNYKRKLQQQDEEKKMADLKQQEAVINDGPPEMAAQEKQASSGGFSLWKGLRKRLNFVGLASSQNEEEEEDGNQPVEIALTIHVNEHESVRVPLDLTEHDSLQTFTSQWLQDQIFKVVKEKRLATRSASHSKSSTDVAGSEDGLSQQRQYNQKMLAQLEPVCLSTVQNEAECIDFLLTKKNKMVATFLPMDVTLKVNYVDKDEIEEELTTKAVPSLRNFDFIKVLGTGGFATVYMVRKRTTGMLYAMKLVKKDGVKQDEVKFAQVYTERQILERLKNPFLVQLHYAFVTTNYYCLVIDLCTGGELFYYLQKHQSFQLSNAKLLFAEVVLAIEFLHSNDIMYRDLKPENILVDEQGHLRLTDFGLCKPNFKQGRSRARSFVGSPEYMSPEILLDRGYNYSVDYYTLGVLLYEMLVGLPPHYNEDKIQMYKDITMKEPSIPSVLPEDARDLLDRLLKIEPANRLGMGPGGILEIKNHPFFSEIDWHLLEQKAPAQGGRKRLPLEVNLLESNFDRQYTRLPINIDVTQEELIKINEPIQIPPQKLRIRSKSFTKVPYYGNPHHQRMKSQHAKQQQRTLLQQQHKNQSFKQRRKGHRNSTLLSGQSQHGEADASNNTTMFKNKSHYVRRRKAGNNRVGGSHSRLNKLTNSGKLTSSIPGQVQARFAEKNSSNSTLAFPDMQRNENDEQANEGLQFALEPDRRLQRQNHSNKLMMMSASTMLAMQNSLTENRHMVQQYSHNLQHNKKLAVSQEEAYRLFQGMSTVEKQSSMQQISQIDFKNSQSVLDELTEEVSVAQECLAGEDAAAAGIMRQLMRQQARNLLKSKVAGLGTAEVAIPREGKVSTGTPFLDSLSPFGIPDLAGKASMVPPMPMKQHGFSEYNKRRIGQDYQSGSKGKNQDSAFNFRKQTLADEEISVYNQSSYNDNELTSGGVKEQLNNLQQTALSNNDPERTMWQMHNTSVTPNRNLQHMAATPLATGAILSEKQIPLITPYKNSPQSNLAEMTPHMRHEGNNYDKVRTLEQRIEEELVLQEEVTSEYKAIRIMPESNTNQFINLVDEARQNQLQLGLRPTSPSDFTAVTQKVVQSANLDEEYQAPRIGDFQSPPLSLSVYSSQLVSAHIEINISPSKSEDKQEFRSFHAYASFGGENLAQLQPPLYQQSQHSSQQCSSDFQSHSSDFEEEDSDGESIASLAEEIQDSSSMDQSDNESEAGTQIEPSKIQVLNKFKSKKQKKRLSEKNSTSNKKNDEKDCVLGANSNEQQDLQYQYGFSVEQQKERQNHGVQVVRFNQQAAFKNVQRHQTSNISNLLAQSVVHQHTPRIFSKQSSQEKLPSLPESKKHAFLAHKPSSLQHSKLIKFTEKAAGVVSERNRKFQKPQTLKNLEQKLLQADEDQDIDMMYTEEGDPMGPIRTSEHNSQVVEMFYLDMPLDDLKADEQLNFNSEMISIDEFESENEEDATQLDVAIDIQELQLTVESNESGDGTQVANEDVDVSSEEVGIDASPVLQFQSQSMGDIKTPLHQKEAAMTTNELPAEEEVEQAFVIRESISSPNIMSGKLQHQQKQDFVLGIISHNSAVEASQSSQYATQSVQPVTFDVMSNDYTNWFLRQASPPWKASSSIAATTSTNQQQKTHFGKKAPKIASQKKRNLGSPSAKHSLLHSGAKTVSMRDSQMVLSGIKPGNTAVNFQDFQTSSKKISIVLPPSSPYTHAPNRRSKDKSQKLARAPLSRVSNTKAVVASNQSLQGVPVNSMLTRSSFRKNKSGVCNTTQKTKKSQQSQLFSQAKHMQNLQSTTAKQKNYCKNQQQLSKQTVNGNNSTMNLSSRKGPTHQLQRPPKQPTLIDSPMQKLMGTSEEQLPPLSLRLVVHSPVAKLNTAVKRSEMMLNTPSQAGPSGPTLLSASQICGPHNSHIADFSSKVREKLTQMTPPSQEQIVTSGTKKRLATASSHLSFLSQGKNSSARRSRNQAGADISKFATVQTIQIDKDAYARYKDGPMANRAETMTLNAAHKGLIKIEKKTQHSRSSADLSLVLPQQRQCETARAAGAQSGLTQAVSGRMSLQKLTEVFQQPQLQQQSGMKVGQARQSIFEVVDDIMNSLVLTGKQGSKDFGVDGPYGMSRSPEIKHQSLNKKASNIAISEQITFLKEIQKTGVRGPLSASDSKDKQICGGFGTRKNNKSKNRLTNLLAPTRIAKLNRFTMRTFSQVPGSTENHQLVTDGPRRMSLPQEPETLLSPITGGARPHQQKQPVKKAYASQVRPIEPLESSQQMPTFLDEDDSTDLRPQLHALNENPEHSLIQASYFPSLMASSAKVTPCRGVLRLNKTRLLGRGSKRTHGLNETSVEVLKLDASQFSSLSEQDLTRGSNHKNLLTLKSEEHLLGGGRSTKSRKKLNSTFQYKTAQMHDNQTKGAADVKNKCGVLTAEKLFIDCEDVTETIGQEGELAQTQNADLPLANESDSMTFENVTGSIACETMMLDARRGSTVLPTFIEKNQLLSLPTEGLGLGGNGLDELRSSKNNTRVLSAGDVRHRDVDCSRCSDSHEAAFLSSDTENNKMPIAKVPQKKYNQSNKSQAAKSSFISVNGVHVHSSLTSAQAAKMPSQHQKAGPGSLVSRQAKSRQYSNNLTNKTKQSKKASQIKSTTNQALATDVLPNQRASLTHRHQQQKHLNSKKSLGGISISSTTRAGHKQIKNPFSDMSSKFMKPQSPQLISKGLTAGINAHSFFPKKVSVDLLGASAVSTTVIDKPRHSTSSLKMLLNYKDKSSLSERQ